MHDEARQYVERWKTNDKINVVEIGSRYINGQVRDLFPNASHIGIDLQAGQHVDEVADGATWKPKRKADLVVCCEVFEHTADWREIVLNTYDNILKVGGRFIVTAAGPSRRAHSAIDGGPLHHDEWYENITANDLEAALTIAGFENVEVEEHKADVRATGVK